MSSVKQSVQEMVSIDLPQPPKLSEQPLYCSHTNTATLTQQKQNLTEHQSHSNHDYSIKAYTSNTLVRNAFSLESRMALHFRFTEVSRNMHKPPRHTSTVAQNIMSKNITGRQSHERYHMFEAQFNTNKLDGADTHDFEALNTGVERERARWKKTYAKYMLEHMWVLRYVSTEALQTMRSTLQQQLLRLSCDSHSTWCATKIWKPNHGSFSSFSSSSSSLSSTS